MPRVHVVKKARKADKAAGIRKGDTYYWWKFRYGGLRKSLTPPKPSQLTQSEFLSTVLAAQEELEKAFSGGETGGEISRQDALDALNAAMEEVRSQGDECSDKVSNMESVFTGGSPTIDLLQSRADKCEELASELEEIISEIDNLPDEEDDGALCDTCGHDRVSHNQGEEQDTCSECGCPTFEYDRSELDEQIQAAEALDWSFE